MQDFLRKFNFRKDGALLVGVERECFLVKKGKISPISPEVLTRIGINGRFGFELSACQLEDRIGPTEVKNVKIELLKNEEEIKKAESEIGFERLFLEVAPDDMPLDVYPDPSGRYQRITEKMSKEVLLAACQVTGIHIHIGMPDHETAIKVYNSVIDKVDLLCKLGDKSNGRRLDIYRVVAPDFYPPRYKNFTDFYREATEKNFVNDPRSCWHIVRISVHGTIEFRMFGSTENLDEVVMWAERCHSLCKEALEA